MKKVKTIIASLVVIFASIFVSACSCGDSSAPQVYVDDINIALVSEKFDEQNRKLVWGDTSQGKLIVHCRVGETFQIAYTLDPVDATLTQVNWEFSKSGLVKTVSGESYRKKSTKETIDFKAMKRDGNNYTTTLTFTANITGSGHSTEKEVKCDIIVEDVIEEQSTLSTPTNIHFNNSTNKIEWNKVTSLIDSNGKVLDSSNSNINMSDCLSGYEITFVDKDGNESKVGGVGYRENACAIPEEGKEYTVSVQALGTDTVNTSDMSEDYKFFKIKDVDSITNDNGSVKFGSPDGAYQFKIYYYGVEEKGYYWPNSLATGDNKINNVSTSYFNKTSQNDQFKIQIEFLPTGSDENGHALIDGVHYFSSTPKTTKIIQKLAVPEISLYTPTTGRELNGVSFSKAYGDTKLKFAVRDYEGKYETKFEYKITNKNDNSKDDIVGTTNNTQDYFSLLGNLTVGQYGIQVKTIGNASETVESAYSSEFVFDITSEDQSNKFSYSLENDVLELKGLIGGGMEVFFVSTSSTSKNENSKRVEIPYTTGNPSVDISELGLKAGTYTLCVRHIPTNSNGHLAIISGVKQFENNIEVANTPQDFKITSDGNIEFTKPSTERISQYTVAISVDGVRTITLDAVASGASAGQVEYTTSGSKISISLFDVVRQIIVSTAGTDVNINDSETVDQLIMQYLYGSNSDKTLTCQVKAKVNSDSNGVGYETTQISSAFTTPLEFSGASVVTDCKLEDYTLKFKLDGDKQFGFMVELIVYDDNNSTKYQFSHTGAWTKSGEYYTADLTKEICITDGDCKGKTLAELVDVTKNNAISVITLGRVGDGTQSAIVNTMTSKTGFAVANTPTDLRMDQDNKVYWKTTSNVSEAGKTYTYTIYLEVLDDKESVTLTTLSKVRPQLSGEECYYDLSDILSENADKVVSICIVENEKGMFSSARSEKFYTTKISAPVLNYSVASGEDVISWNAINNAKNYKINVTKDGDDEFTFTETTIETLNFSISNMITNQNWGEGVYTISIVACTDLVGSSSAENPYVISSAPAEKVVRIVSQNLAVTVDDTTISWNNICAGTDTKATYAITYNGTTLVDSQFDNKSTSYDIGSKLNAGNNTITITPRISYVDTGFILIGNLNENNITKLSTPTALSATNGNLVFTVAGLQDSKSIGIELYQKDTDGKYKLVPAGDYTIADNPTKAESGYGYTYTLMLDGLAAGKDLDLKVRVTADNIISSEISSNLEKYKLATIANLDKSSNQLTWTTGDVGVNKFVLTYWAKGKESESKIIELSVEYKNGNYTCYVQKDDEAMVEADTKFKCTKNDGRYEFTYAFDVSVFVGDNVGEIYITIRALAKDGYYNGNTSTTHTIIKLNTNTEVTAEDGVLSIEKYATHADDETVHENDIPSQYTLSIYLLQEKKDATEGEDNYERSDKYYKFENVAYDGVAGIASIDLNDIGLPTFGLYEIELQYIGDSNNILDSVVKTVRIEKLNINTLSTYAGQIAWDAVEGAEDYTLEISTAGEEPKSITISATPVDGKIIISESQLVYSDGEENQTYKIEASNRKQYTLRLRANSEGRFYSQWSETFTIRKLLAPTQVSIKTNVSEDLEIDEEKYDVGTPIITWVDGNVNNSQFTYELLYGTTENMVTINQTTDKKYILRRDLDVGDYKLLLRVVGNTTTESSNIGLLTSDYYENSNTVAKYIKDVDGIKVENGIISWTDITQAYAYKVSAYSGDTLQFSVYSHTNSINFSDLTIGNENNPDGGTFQFVVNAITDPRDAIITSAGEETQNSATIFKPNTLSNFRVKNGQLNWRISIADIKGLVDANMDKLKENFENVQGSGLVTLAVIKYVLGVINKPESEQNETLNDILTYLLKVRLNINSVELVDTPTSVIVVDNDGNEVTDTTKYLSDDKYLEYSYEVSIEPTISDISSDNGDEEVDGGDEENEVDIATQSEEATAIEYTAGKYNIRISTVGNSSSELPIVSGGYTTTLTAYKPNAPVTWKSGNGDITEGRVQWNLSTTPETDGDGFKYHQDYKITAVSVQKGELESKAYKIVNVGDTEENGKNQNLSNGYQYYRDLKDDLFKTVGDTGDTNVLGIDVEYRLLINVMGTADSMAEDAGEYIYLNSNACVVASHVNFLSNTRETKVESNTLTWEHSTGSTMTRVFIYGPFDTVDDYNKNYRDIEWKENTHNKGLLETIYNAYLKENNGDYDASKLSTYSNEEIKEYAKLLKVYDFRDEKDGRKKSYTLTDDQNFAPGGYRIFFQEIGDGHGVLDSEQTDYNNALAVEKLATPEVQATGWIGTKDSTIYVRDYSETIDGWKSTTDYDKDPLPSKVGTFVWNCVAGANAYQVELYRNDEVKPCYSGKTRKTMFEPSDAVEYKAGDKFYIKVRAVRLADESGETDTVTYASNFFYSDDMEVSGDGLFERLVFPVDMQIYSDGTIKWNINTTENANIGGYYVRIGYGNNVKYLELTTNQGSVNGVFNLQMSDTTNGAGDIVISLKTMAGNGKGLLNSSYGENYQVHLLADPNARVQDGVFNWGWTNGDTIVDPLTDSQLTIDGKTQTISVSDLKTFYAYYTDIVKHDSKYESSNDETTFAIGEHTFKVKFLGTGGDGTQLALNKDDQYIASSEKTLTATKLSSPEIENVQLQLADDETENMVQWKKIENAQGYRVRVFVRGVDEYYDYKISLDDLEKNDSESFFATYGENGNSYAYVQFKLKDVINRFIKAENGGELYIYVQALGTEDSTQLANGTLYLSSSYSTSVTVGTPPCPRDIAFSGETGLLTWNFGDNEIGAYGIKLKTQYTVSGVTSDELNTYWIDSAHEYALGNADYTTNKNPATPETLSGVLQKRSIRYTEQSNGKTYDVVVVDMLYLKESGTTPTSYKVTTIASNYSFEITAIAFNGESSDDSGFSSPTVLYDAATAFSAFGKGDGSSKYVYTVENYTQLDRIRNFADRAFILTSDIDMTLTTTNDAETWNIVTQDFTGSLDGNNKTITLSKWEGVSNSDYTKKDYALFSSNSGTISNLTVKVAINESGNFPQVSMAVIAVENSGIIDNVTIDGSMVLKNVTSHGYGAERIAGIAVENTGTIRNSTVNATIVASSKQAVYGGGIVAENKGTIDGCVFAGEITANQVGGISSDNYGTIERSYTTENAEINVTDVTLEEGDYIASSAGGISARTHSGSTIKYSYSLATIYVTRRGTDNTIQTHVGGLVGAIDKDDSKEITITGNYVVSKIYMAKDEKIPESGLFKYDILPTSDSESYADNYYLVEEKDGYTSITSSTSNGGTKCDDLAGLKNKLATIKDGENSVYITTGDGYPTLDPKSTN